MVATLTKALAERAAAHGRVAIDTEFVSERRYQALLCLAQVAVPDPDAPDGVRTEVIDPLSDDPPDPAPLARVLADPDVEVVVHAGRQDIAILRRTWSTDVTRVFDTQLAAGFIGFGNQESYESLVRKVLNVRLKGAEGFTRWDRRPLTEQQLEYAGDDARLLLGLGQEIERRLDERGRLEWAREECRALEESSDERDPERVYDRLPRLARLNERGRAVARELVEWREETARTMDRPAGYVLPDQALIELARRAPSDRAGLEQIRGLPAQTLHRRGDRLVEAIERGRERPAPPAPPEPGPREPADAPLVSLAQALVRHRSSEAGVAVELIATQAELTALVSALRRGDSPDPQGGLRGVRAAQGWRRELVGDELVRLVDGRVGLSAATDGGLTVHEL
jgi:ribonuclease D